MSDPTRQLTAQDIPDAQLFAYADRAKGQVVLITGAGAGLGRAAALDFAKRGAKVVIGDLNFAGAEETVQLAKAAGGEAASFKVDVTDWDQLCAYFQFAEKQYGRIDAVIPNAGVTEIGTYFKYELEANGLPQRPNFKTLEINLLSVMNTTRLATHFLQKNENKDSLKAVVWVGSMASINGIYGAPMYGASKHGVLGFARSSLPSMKDMGIRTAVITPWFADTAIVPLGAKVAMAGVPLSPIYRIAGAMFLAATDQEPESNGAVYAIPDQREVFRVPHTDLNEGVYKLMGDRVKQIFGFKQRIMTIVDIVRFAWRGGLIQRLGFVGLLGGVGYAFYSGYAKELIGKITSH